MSSEELCLAWDDHHKTLIGCFEKLLESSSLVDCTIAAEGQYLRAHKVVLSACSPYFEVLFAQESEKNPIVILKDISFQDLRALIDFIYCGKVQIPEDRLAGFADAAESLQINGLGGVLKRSISESLGRVSPCFHRREGDDSSTRKRRRNGFPVVNELTLGGAIPETIVTNKNQFSENVPLCFTSAISAVSGTLPSAPFHAFRVQKEYSDTKSCSAVRLMDSTGEVRPQPMSEMFLSELKCLIEPKSEVCLEEMSVLGGDNEDGDSMSGCMDREENTNSGGGGGDGDNFPKAQNEQDYSTGEDIKPAVCGDIFEGGGENDNFTSCQGEQDHITGDCDLLESKAIIEDGGENDNFPSWQDEQDHITGEDDLLESSEAITKGTSATPVKSGSHHPPASATTTTTLHPAARSVTDVPASVPRFAASVNVATVHIAPPVAADWTSRTAGNELPRRHECLVCNKIFLSFQLVTHMRVHTGDRSFKCDVCGYVCSLKCNLEMRKHNVDRPFKCELCGKAYKLKNDLQYHLRVHTKGHTGVTSELIPRPTSATCAGSGTRSTKCRFPCVVDMTAPNSILSGGSRV